MKICIFDVLEPSGPSKSDSWLKNDSFWWGARLRTSKIRLFHIFVDMYGAESHRVAYLAQLLTDQDAGVTPSQVWPSIAVDL